MSSPPQLNPGDAVVPLASLGVQSPAIAGGVILGQLAYRADSSGLGVLLCVAIGLGVGAATGHLIGRFAYPAAGGHVVVVKAGRSALAKTLAAALFPAYAVAVALAVAAPIALGGPSAAVVMLVAGVSATSVGLVFGIGSALA